MAVNFPINPTPGQSYTAEGGTWVWNGSQWTVHGGGITEGDADARYLKLTGGTLTGPLVVTADASVTPASAATNSYLLVKRFDGKINGALFHVQSTDEVILHKRAADGLTTQSELRFSATDLRLTGLSATTPAADSVLNRDRADARYHRLNTALEALTSVTITPSAAATNPALWLKRFDATTAGLFYWENATDVLGFQKRAANGSTVQTTIYMAATDTTFGGLTAAPGAESVMSRARGDDRYLQLTGGTLTGGLTVANSLVVKLSAASGANGHLWFHRFNASIAGLLYHDATAEQIALRKYGTDGSTVNSEVRLTVDDVILNGTLKAGVASNSIVSVARGDARYLGLAGGTVTGNLTVNGTFLTYGSVYLRRNVNTDYNTVNFQDAGGVVRWAFVHANVANGDFRLHRNNSAGTYQDAPISVSSANGQVTLGGPLVVNCAGNGDVYATSLDNSYCTFIPRGANGVTRGYVQWNLTDNALRFATINAAGAGQGTMTMNAYGLDLTTGVYLGNGAGRAALMRVRDGTNYTSFQWTSPNGIMNISNVVEFVIGTSSDYRLKDEIGAIDSPLDLIDQLRPLRYHTKEAVGFETLGVDDPAIEHHGLIAHEVQELIPSIVMGEKDGDMLQSINYAGLVPLLIAAMQELKAKVAALEAA